MNKKLMITIACLMSVGSVSAFRFTDYVPTWQSVRNVFTSTAQQPSAFDKYFVQPIANNLVKPINDRVQNAVNVGQRAAVYTAAPRYAYNFMSTNPYSATGVGFAAGSYPKLILPLLGAGAAAYTLKQYQDFHAVNENDFSQEEKNSSQRRRIAKRIFAGLGGALGTLAFMKKPKMMSVVSILAGLAYKFKVGPFADNAAASEDVDHKDGVVCDPETGVCAVQDNS